MTVLKKLRQVATVPAIPPMSRYRQRMIKIKFGIKYIIILTKRVQSLSLILAKTSYICYINYTNSIKSNENSFGDKFPLSRYESTIHLITIKYLACVNNLFKHD